MNDTRFKDLWNDEPVERIFLHTWAVIDFTTRPVMITFRRKCTPEKKEDWLEVLRGYAWPMIMRELGVTERNVRRFRYGLRRFEYGIQKTKIQL